MTGKILYAFDITLGLACDMAPNSLVRGEVRTTEPRRDRWKTAG
ncbi:hypothetical protein [Streptosporangium sp. NPDC002524]